MKNLQGDIIGITDTSGNIVAKYTYDSWGKLISIKDANDVDKTIETEFIGYINPLRYRGYYYDTETGLYYLNARYYDPEVGRFISADETLDGGYNLFEYCANNVINYLDLTGKALIQISYMRCIGPSNYADAQNHAILFNCWNHVTSKIDGIIGLEDPPGYTGNRAGVSRTNQDLANATMLGLRAKNAQNVTLLGELSESQLLSAMHNLPSNKILVAFRQNLNSSGDYHYMVYYNGEWTQKYGKQGEIFKLENGITPNADIVWCVHYGNYKTGEVFWNDNDSTIPVYDGPTWYIEATIH